DNRRAEIEAEPAQQRSQVIHGSPRVGVPHFAAIAVPGDLVNTYPWEDHPRALDRPPGETVSTSAPATLVPGRGPALGSAPSDQLPGGCRLSRGGQPPHRGGRTFSVALCGTKPLFRFRAAEQFSTLCRASGSTGLTKCCSKPASSERRRSSSCP